jgi:hypothetical protein
MSIFEKIFNSGVGQSKGQYYIIGRVTKIITDASDPDYNSPDDIGKIKYDLIYSTLGTSKSENVSEEACPIFNFISQYPLLNETVLIVPGPTERLNDRKTRQQAFYFPPYRIWNSPNHGAFPNMSQWGQFLSSFTNKPNYQGSSTANNKLPLGLTFQEKEEVKKLKYFEGDTILQARFGQSIRFGSTVPAVSNMNTWSNYGKNGSPITIITNEQGSRKELGQFDTFVEDINRDGSSIYMTSTQEINLDLIDFPLNSFGVKIKPLTQTVVETSRVPVSNYGTSAADQDKNSENYYV